MVVVLLSTPSVCGAGRSPAEESGGSTGKPLPKLLTEQVREQTRLCCDILLTAFAVAAAVVYGQRPQARALLVMVEGWHVLVYSNSSFYEHSQALALLVVPRFDGCLTCVLR